MKGFTLVEVLVAIGIVAVTGVIFVAIFSSTLKGSNKSQILAVIKQNGQAVLENMDKTVRGSDNIVCAGSQGNTLVVVKNGVYTRFRIVTSGVDNGSIQQDFPVQPQTGSQINLSVFINAICDDNDPMDSSRALTLTDTNAQTGISVVHAKNDLGNDLPYFEFDRNNSIGSKEIVKMQFALKAGSGVPAAIAGQIDPVVFQTTIELR